MSHLYFNSIKVRLEQVQNEPTLLSSEFQFHKGTIRTAAKGFSEAVKPISIP